MGTYYTPPVDRETLYYEYWNTQLSCSKMAAKHGVTSQLIKSWLKKYNIPTRNKKESALLIWDVDRTRKPKIKTPKTELPYQNRDVLYNYYWNEKKSTSEIAELYNIKGCTVLYWMGKLEIPTRSHSERTSLGNKKKKHEQHKVLVNCSWCNKEMEMWPYRVRLSTDCYCSKECKSNHWSIIYAGENSHNWKGGEWTERVKATQHGRFRKVRKTMLERDENKCVLCGSSKKLAAHHIIAMKENKELAYEINNLITLCSDCHNFKVNYREDEFKELFTGIIAKMVNCWEPLRASIPQQG